MLKKLSRFNIRITLKGFLMFLVLLVTWNPLVVGMTFIFYSFSYLPLTLLGALLSFLTLWFIGSFFSIYAAIISIIIGISSIYKNIKQDSTVKKQSLVLGLVFFISGVISLYLIPISTFFKNPSYDPNLISPKQEVYWVTNSHWYAFKHSYGLSTLFLGEGGSPALLGWDKDDNLYYSYYRSGGSGSNVYRKNISKNSPEEDLGSIDFLPKGLITSKSVGQSSDSDCKDPIYFPSAGSACNEFSVGQTQVQLESGYIIAIKNSSGTKVNYVHFVRSVALSPDEKYLAVLSSLGGGAYATGDIFYIKFQ